MNKQYIEKYKTRSYYRQMYLLETYKIINYQNPLLKIIGTTRCGLYFMIKINEFKIFTFAAQKTLDDCETAVPNQTLNLADFKVFNNHFIDELCYDLKICNFIAAKCEISNKQDQAIYESWCKSYKNDNYNYNYKLNNNKNSVKNTKAFI